MNIHTKARHYLEHDRFFYSHSNELNIGGWYTETREGIRGPFKEKGSAKKILMKLINSRPSRR
jgi:hypothetical protein